MADDVPSIKGRIFARGAEDLLKLVADGGISWKELERRLPEGDVEILRQRVNPGDWYDVQVYGRLLELLKVLEGGGRNEYLRERGAGSAEALIRAGIYPQMEYLNRTQASQQGDTESRFEAFGRDLRLLTSLHGSILNFGQQTPVVDPDHAHRYRIEIREAAPMPDALCWTTDGFMNRMSSQHRMSDLWRWERPSRDLVIYRMTRTF
jgi:hypothetical protein